MRLLSARRAIPAPDAPASPAARYAADAASRLTLPELTGLLARLEGDAQRAFARGDPRAARRAATALEAYRIARRVALIRRLHSVGLAVRGRDRRVAHDQARADRRVDRLVERLVQRSAVRLTGQGRPRPLIQTPRLLSLVGEHVPCAPRPHRVARRTTSRATPRAIPPFAPWTPPLVS